MSPVGVLSSQEQGKRLFCSANRGPVVVGYSSWGACLPVHPLLFSLIPPKASATRRDVCGVTAPPWALPSLKPLRLQSSGVKTLTLSSGKFFSAVLLRFDLVPKIVNDYVSKSVRMLCA